MVPTKVQSVDLMRTVGLMTEDGVVTPGEESEMKDLTYLEIIPAQSYEQMTGQALSLSDGQAALYTTKNEGKWPQVTMFGQTFSVAQWL